MGEFFTQRKNMNLQLRKVEFNNKQKMNQIKRL